MGDFMLELDVAIIKVGCDGWTFLQAGLSNGHRDDITSGGSGRNLMDNGMFDGRLILASGLHKDATARSKFFVDFVHFCAHPTLVAPSTFLYIEFTLWCVDYLFECNVRYGSFGFVLSSIEIVFTSTVSGVCMAIRRF